jgi:hypothetical protein
MSISKILLGLLLIAGPAQAAPVISLGTSDDYCVVFCYVRTQYTITHYESARNIGMIYCDIDAEVIFFQGGNNGEARTKQMHESTIGAFKNTGGEIKGAVEFDTGISKKNFRGSRVKSAACHL